MNLAFMVSELESRLTVWRSHLQTGEPASASDQPHPRSVAAESVNLIDDIMKHLHQLRSDLITETRHYDDENGARVDALLARLKAERAAVAFDEAATLGDVVVRTMTKPDGTYSDRGIAVAVNQLVVPRADWASTPLSTDDKIEIITAVQGG